MSAAPLPPPPFGEALRSKGAQIALDNFVDEEIKLLDHMREFMWKRSTLDGEYARKLHAFNRQMRTHAPIISQKHGPAAEAWEAVLAHSEQQQRLVLARSEALQGSVLQALDRVTTIKKKSQKFFVSERNRLRAEIERLHKLVTTARAQAVAACKELSDAHEKYVRGLQKDKEVGLRRTRYISAATKFQLAYNTYQLSVVDYNDHGASHDGKLIRTVLNTLEGSIVHAVEDWRRVFQ
eukprot:UC1_evm1s88